MSSTVRVNAGFSDKVTVDYNSRQYSIALEMDLTINGSTKEIEDASARLFNLCRKIVNAQKDVSVDGLLQSQDDSMNPPVVPTVPASVPLPPAHQTPALPASDRYSRRPAPPPGTARPATNKQLNYLVELGKKAGLTDEQIRGLSQQYYSKPSLGSLSSKEASDLIDQLQEKRQAA